MRSPALPLALLTLAAHAEIIDRIAVSVGSTVITASDIERSIRVTAFLNGTQPDLTATNRRATAGRLVDQKLVKRELELAHYPRPVPAAADPELAGFQKQHYPKDGDFARALMEYGINVQDVKDELLWQLTFLRFVEVRFRPGVQVTDQDVQKYFDETVKPAAQAARPGESISLDDYRSQIEAALTGKRADQELETWLQETRRRTEIVFHEEVFH